MVQALVPPGNTGIVAGRWYETPRDPAQSSSPRAACLTEALLGGLCIVRTGMFAGRSHLSTCLLQFLETDKTHKIIDRLITWGFGCCTLASIFYLQPESSTLFDIISYNTELPMWAFPLISSFFLHSTERLKGDPPTSTSTYVPFLSLPNLAFWVTYISTH